MWNFDGILRTKVNYKLSNSYIMYTIKHKVCLYFDFIIVTLINKIDLIWIFIDLLKICFAYIPP